MRPVSCLLACALVFTVSAGSAEAFGIGARGGSGTSGGLHSSGFRDPGRLGQLAFRPNRFGRTGQFGRLPGIYDGYGLAAGGSRYGVYGSRVLGAGARYGDGTAGYGFGGQYGYGGYPFTFGRYAYDQPADGYAAGSPSGPVVVQLSNVVATGIPAPPVLPPAVYVINPDSSGQHSTSENSHGVRVVNLTAAAAAQSR